MMSAQKEGMMLWWFLLETRPTYRISGVVLTPRLPWSCQLIVLCTREVTLEEATAKSQQLNIMFMETSAKAGHNVKSLFKKIAMSLPGMEKENSKTETNSSG